MIEWKIENLFLLKYLNQISLPVLNGEVCCSVNHADPPQPKFIAESRQKLAKIVNFHSDLREGGHVSDTF